MRPDDPLYIDESVRVWLSEAEAREIGFRARAGDAEAAETLVRYGMFWCHELAAKYARRAEGRRINPALLEEYAGVARVGLVKASRGWDPDRGTFLTYATWRMRSHLRQLMDQLRKGRQESAGLCYDVADEVQGGPCEFAALSEVAGLALDRLRALDGKQENIREVILAYYGIDGDPASLAEIAEARGIHLSSASRCHVAGLKLLRRHLELNGVTDAEI